MRIPRASFWWPRTVRCGTVRRASSTSPSTRAESCSTSPHPATRKPADVARAYEFGVLATAAQLVGAGQAMLDASVEYAKQRSQFGRVIGSYQSIKHKLADVLIAIELARPLLYGAALSLADNSADTARDVSAAKVAASDAALLAARSALQTHGAIGFTQEHDLSLWLLRVQALRSAWGDPTVHRRRVLEAL